MSLLFNPLTGHADTIIRSTDVSYSVLTVNPSRYSLLDITVALAGQVLVIRLQERLDLFHVCE